MHRPDETMMVRLLMLLSGVSLSLQQDVLKPDLEATCFSVGTCMPEKLPEGEHRDLCRVFEEAVTCMQGSVEACRQLDFPAEQLEMSELKIKELRQNLDSHCASFIRKTGFEMTKSSERTDKGELAPASTSGHRAVLGTDAATPEPYDSTMDSGAAATTAIVASTTSFPFSLLLLVISSLLSSLCVTAFFSSAPVLS